MSAIGTGLFQYFPQLPSRNRRHDCIVLTQGIVIIHNHELWCYVMSNRKILKSTISRASSGNFQSEVQSDDLDSDDLSTSTLETSML